MDLQCLSLDRNHSYCIIFDFFSGIISFGFCFQTSMRFIFSEKLFTLVSNMQISRRNLIIYNFYNWSDSFTLIYRYSIIFFRALTYSSAVRLYSCIAPTFCSLGDLDGFAFGTYDVTEIGYLEGPELLFTWRSGCIHNWCIWWYRAKIFVSLDWRNWRRKLLGPVARWLTWISCWNCNWF